MVFTHKLYCTKNPHSNSCKFPMSVGLKELVNLWINTIFIELHDELFTFIVGPEICSVTNSCLWEVADNPATLRNGSKQLLKLEMHLKSINI